jgi:hypothetical protein
LHFKGAISDTFAKILSKQTMRRLIFG